MSFKLSLLVVLVAVGLLVGACAPNPETMAEPDSNASPESDVAPE